jgi:hypothetical protein
VVALYYGKLYKVLCDLIVFHLGLAPVITGKMYHVSGYKEKNGQESLSNKPE